MPNDHVGALSGVTYRIPDLDDNADVEVAFTQFADTLPPAPKALSYLTATGNVNPGVVNNMYINEHTGPITITLPPGEREGDKIIGYQIGNTGTEVSLVGGPGVGYQGPQATTGQYTAVTAIWHVDPDTGAGKWVGSPFSFSGERPTSSLGGEVIDLNGRRYHVFTEPGSFTFVSDRDQMLLVTTIGGGGPGVPGAVGTSGEGGYGGQVQTQAYQVYGLDYVPVTVPTAGGDAVFGTMTAVGGPAGVPGTPTPGTPPSSLDADLATILGVVTAGGDGGNAVGPTSGGIGQGGGGGFNLLAPYPQSSYEHSWTTGGTYDYDCSYGARAEQYQTGQTTVQGDRPVPNDWNGQCPGGWWNALVGDGYRCCTSVPTYGTRYICDSGGSLSGTTCVRTCQGNNSQSHTETVWNPCNAGYAEVNHTCVDARPAGGGQGGPGAVVVSYPIPE